LLFCCGVYVPHPMASKTPPEIRFWRKVQRGQPDQCWPWLGDKTSKGYGRFVPYPKHRDENGVRPNPQMAHRLVLMYSGITIEPGMEVCHRCDNPSCVNPDHLFVGSHADNMADMRSKGRAAQPKGELHGESKLTTKDVVAIRTMYRPGVVSHLQLARLFGVSKRLIQMVIHREAWRHIP
jgi:hypothetical protein